MPVVNNDTLKVKFGDKKRPNSADFTDLIDSCINDGYTGVVNIGTSIFTIANGIITDITTPDPNSIIDSQSSDSLSIAAPSLMKSTQPSTAKVKPTSSNLDSISLKSGTGYDGIYVHEDKIFPCTQVLKVYVNQTTRNRFISYKDTDGKYYWHLIKRGWFGTIECLTTQPGLKTDFKSKPFDAFTDLLELKGDWSTFFNESDVRPNTKTSWSIS
jgi:hypothetical protein